MRLMTVLRTDAAVRDRLKAVIRKPRWTMPPMLVPRCSHRSNLTGTAFDYLVRFEPQRRHPVIHVHHGGWVAESVLPFAPTPHKARLAVTEARQVHAAFLAGAAAPRDMAFMCTALELRPTNHCPACTLPNSCRTQCARWSGGSMVTTA